MRERRVRVSDCGEIVLPDEALYLLDAIGGGEILVHEENGRIILTRPTRQKTSDATRARDPAARVWLQPQNESEEEG